MLKPSEQNPLTTLKLAELVADLLPAGVLNVVTGYGPEVGGRLSSHPDIDMIALTGPVGSGRAVAKAAAESLKRVHLELGGKAPVIVFDDADLAAAATSLRAAGYWNSGQECGAGVPGPRYFVPPTVLVDVPGDAEVAREEIFGPVVSVETFETEDAAIHRANDVPYGLAASVFTESSRRGLDVPSKLDFGTVW